MTDTPRLSLIPLDDATAQAIIDGDRAGRAWHEGSRARTTATAYAAG